MFSGDSAGSACGFLLSCGSFRNLRRGREEAITIIVCVAVGKRQEENDKAKEGQRPEEEFLSSLLFDDVELVVVPQSTGHFLIGHVVSVL